MCDEKRARVHCSNARAQKICARFFRYKYQSPSHDAVYFARTINRCRRLLLFSALGSHLRAIDLAMSLSNVDATAPAASLMVWRFGSAQLQEYLQRVICHTKVSDKDTYIRPPEFTNRLYKLPKQKIYCYSNYECYHEKGTATLIKSFRFKAFNFGDPIEIQLSLWRERGGQRFNIGTGT